MNLNYAFPTVILSNVDEPLAKEMLPIAKKYLNNPKFINKNYGYKTTYDSHGGLENFNEFNKFKQYICQLGFDFLHKQGYKLDFDDFSPRICTSEMYKGDVHNVHAHPNAVLSGIFYLQVPNGSSPIMFFDPRPKRHFISREIEFPTESNLDHIMFNPQRGLMLMWESWLEHCVPNNQNEGSGRITLVFNLHKKFK